jgi:hypothetical protein
MVLVSPPGTRGNFSSMCYSETPKVQELVSNLSSASPLFGFCWTVIEDSLDQRTLGV